MEWTSGLKTFWGGEEKSIIVPDVERKLIKLYGSEAPLTSILSTLNRVKPAPWAPKFSWGEVGESKASGTVTDNNFDASATFLHGLPRDAGFVVGDFIYLVADDTPPEVVRVESVTVNPDDSSLVDLGVTRGLLGTGTASGGQDFSSAKTISWFAYAHLVGEGRVDVPGDRRLTPSIYENIMTKQVAKIEFTAESQTVDTWIDDIDVESIENTIRRHYAKLDHMLLTSPNIQYSSEEEKRVCKGLLGWISNNERVWLSGTPTLDDIVAAFETIFNKFPTLDPNYSILTSRKGARLLPSIISHITNARFNFQPDEETSKKFGFDVYKLVLPGYEGKVMDVVAVPKLDELTVIYEQDGSPPTYHGSKGQFWLVVDLSKLRLRYYQPPQLPAGTKKGKYFTYIQYKKEGTEDIFNQVLVIKLLTYLSIEVAGAGLHHAILWQNQPTYFGS